MRAFISYRRSDSAFSAGRIHDYFVSRWGTDAVFMDVSGIPFGHDFRDVLRRELEICDVLLVVIGEKWLDDSDGGQRRIDTPDDLVRFEIEEALSRRIPVVPVLLGTAQMPTSSQLPGTLRDLAFRNAINVRTDAFSRDIQALAENLERQLDVQSLRPAAPLRAGLRTAVVRTSSLSRTRDFAPAVGIDLGTTFSVVATLNDRGEPQTIVNRDGERLTPSAVLIESDNSYVVGTEALKALSESPEAVATHVKREMGCRLFPTPLCGRYYPPEALQALILNQLRIDGCRQLGDFQQVVITVPAYFDETRRKATQDAGYIAGLDVIDIINEPTAAALAFLFKEGMLTSDGATSSEKNIVVYDLGGGTFDVSVLTIDGHQVRTLATDGDVRLGGRDWDQRIVDFVSEAFIKEQGIDPREDPSVNGRLWEACEAAKRSLSTRQRATIRCGIAGRSKKVEITRESFQKITQDLLDRTAFTLRQTIEAAGLKWSDISHVLMVGGATRMPAVAEMIRKLTGHEPDSSLSPDESVAHGAALYADFLLARHQGRVPRLSFSNVNSHSLAVVALDRVTKRTRTAVLIPRNTQLPASGEKRFSTYVQGQRSVVVEIVEGESISPDNCTRLGKCVIRDLPEDLPAGTHIDVILNCAGNGRVTVTARVPGSGHETQVVIERTNSLSPEQLESWRAHVSGDAKLSPPCAFDKPV